MLQSFNFGRNCYTAPRLSAVSLLALKSKGSEGKLELMEPKERSVNIADVFTSKHIER